MKVEMARRLVVVIGQHGALPPLIEPGAGAADVLVLALGPRVTHEQQRAVEEAISAAFEHRVPFEARLVTIGEAATTLATVAETDSILTHGCSRRDLRALGQRRR